MTSGPTAPAALPPPGLVGLDPQWSRLITTAGLDGAGRTWHVLDNQVAEPDLTLLCVHGNPTWSYLWRDVVAQAPSNVRVIAVDQLNMGFSERTGTFRRLAQRIEDLSAVTEELKVTGPVVTIAHDWGGPISLGWAERHSDQIAGIVLTNTAVHQPESKPVPRLIRMVRMSWVLDKACVALPIFLRGSLMLARPRMAKTVREAYQAPYRSADRRAGIAAFVEDIPLSGDHPTSRVLERVAADLDRFSETPVLFLWGKSDPVFSDLYLDDLTSRFPNAEVHLFGEAGHLVPEDVDVAAAVHTWVRQLGRIPTRAAQSGKRDRLWAALDRRADDDQAAVVEIGRSGDLSTMSFGELEADVRRLAAGLADLGVGLGERVALMVPPGNDLAVCVYACWRMGAVPVIADAGLGARGMSRALASAKPAYLIGITRALIAARLLRWPGVRISVFGLAGALRRLLGIRSTLDELRRTGTDLPPPPAPSSNDYAGIGFTSGATGPAKGVAYRHHQLEAQRDVLMNLYGITDHDRLVAAFGPFALFGPSMGITSVVPDMDVTSPGSLTASALARAVQAVAATLVFASPAALANVARTAGDLSADQAEALKGVRLLMSAGAPVRTEVLKAASDLMPNAEAHTPYGMTEALPVADIDLEEIEVVGPGDGVCVGRPVAGVEIAISGLDSDGRATGDLVGESGIVGEVCIRSAHMRDGYDKLWITQNEASDPAGWHRSGDVGHLDPDGRLWIQGRMGHIITTPLGPVTPVGIEHSVATLSDIDLAAAVGVGPRGTQQLVVVVVPGKKVRRPDIADEDLADIVREQVRHLDVAAVLVAPNLPVDKRHNSKIDRSRIARWAEGVLAGGRMGPL